MRSLIQLIFNTWYYFKEQDFPGRS